METWIPGVLALIGALAGVLLTNLLARATRRSEAKRERLENALRCVVLLIAAQNFTTWIGMDNQPAAATDDDVRALERTIYLKNLESLFAASREARHAVALLVTDGIDVGDAWRSDDKLMHNLDSLYEKLRALV